jgi:hypothetical protein
MKRTAMCRESKLVELRRKTDRDLVILVQKELSRGLTLADVATTKESLLCAQAERAYQTVKTWLPLISGLNRDERGELELKLKELWSALERLPSERVQRYFASASGD